MPLNCRRTIYVEMHLYLGTGEISRGEEIEWLSRKTICETYISPTPDVSFYAHDKQKYREMSQCERYTEEMLG